MRLIDAQGIDWQNRTHFFAVAATLMRRILVDAARRRNSLKRGGGRLRITLDERVAAADESDTDLVALDEALTRLASANPRLSRIVELKYFAGLTEEQVAESLMCRRGPFGGTGASLGRGYSASFRKTNMKAERWELISRIFNDAVAIDGDERQQYLLAACENDTMLAAEVGSLLSAHDKAGDFIERPIVENIVGEISEMPTLTGTLLGPYRIEKSIGRGGMGDVYLATDTRLGRMVALKKLPDRYASDPHLLKRLRTEARAAASLNHPNVATIYSVEEADSRTFITMEYVEGRTLDPLATPGGMDVKRFLDIFGLVASALAHAAR